MVIWELLAPLLLQGSDSAMGHMGTPQHLGTCSAGEVGGWDLPYNELPADQGLVDAVEGAVLSLAARREVEQLLDGSQAAAGIAPALQGHVPVTKGQACVAPVRAGAGVEGRQRDRFIVVFWVARVIDSRAGGRLLGTVKSQLQPPPDPLGGRAGRQDPPQSHRHISHLPSTFSCCLTLLLLATCSPSLSSTLILALLCVIPSPTETDQSRHVSPLASRTTSGARKALSSPAPAPAPDRDSLGPSWLCCMSKQLAKAAPPGKMQLHEDPLLL